MLTIRVTAKLIMVWESSIGMGYWYRSTSRRRIITLALQLDKTWRKLKSTWRNFIWVCCYPLFHGL